jgi:hypothetical protein
LRPQQAVLASIRYVGSFSDKALAIAGRFSARRVLRYLPRHGARFVQGLKDTGFIEGKNLSIEWR